jgi:hypothetical protein
MTLTRILHPYYMQFSSPLRDSGMNKGDFEELWNPGRPFWQIQLTTQNILGILHTVPLYSKTV